MEKNFFLLYLHRKNMIMRKYVWFLIGLLALPTFGQRRKLTLPEAQQIAEERSYDAQRARFSFMASYWAYRSFKAELMPSMGLTGGLMNYERSVASVRNFEDGRIAYVDNNTLSNSLGLSLTQSIVATGGTVSLQSYLYRLDQFNYKEKTYDSQPLRVSYSQPLRSYNPLKWQKKTAPLEYQIAQRDYLSTIEQVKGNVASLFFTVLYAQQNRRQTETKVTDRERLYELTRKRVSLGTSTQSDLMQMELSLLNARVELQQAEQTLTNAQYSLYSYLRVTDYKDVELEIPFLIPDLVVNVDDVVDMALKNSSHNMDQQLVILQYEQSLAQAKANKGIQMSLSSELGVRQTADRFPAAYSHLKDYEVIGLSLSLPIFDWGVSRGKVKMAQAQLDMVRTQQEQQHEDYVQSLSQKVIQFNTQPMQCENALRAQDIAEGRYNITKRRYEEGTASVTDLNTAQMEWESAQVQYLNQLSTFWIGYYTLQQVTLYDWIRRVDIITDFDRLLEQ